MTDKFTALKIRDDDETLPPNWAKTIAPTLLDDYVAPPFEGGADYAESEIKDHGEATVVFFDENDQVTVDPTHAAVEVKRFPHRES